MAFREHEAHEGKGALDKILDMRILCVLASRNDVSSMVQELLQPLRDPVQAIETQAGTLLVHGDTKCYT
jgi:hypothetical protein